MKPIIEDLKSPNINHEFETGRDTELSIGRIDGFVSVLTDKYKDLDDVIHDILYSDTLLSDFFLGKVTALMLCRDLILCQGQEKIGYEF